jgi:hypothetical protein
MVHPKPPNYRRAGGFRVKPGVKNDSQIDVGCLRALGPRYDILLLIIDSRTLGEGVALVPNGLV